MSPVRSGPCVRARYRVVRLARHDAQVRWGGGDSDTLAFLLILRAPPEASHAPFAQGERAARVLGLPPNFVLAVPAGAMLVFCWRAASSAVVVATFFGLGLQRDDPGVVADDPRAVSRERRGVADADLVAVQRLGDAGLGLARSSSPES
jgi:hypothetical protein